MRGLRKSTVEGLLGPPQIRHINLIKLSLFFMEMFADALGLLDTQFSELAWLLPCNGLAFVMFCLSMSHNGQFNGNRVRIHIFNYCVNP